MLRCFLLTTQHVNTYKCLILKLTRLMLLMFWLKHAIYIYLLCTQPNTWIHFIWILLCLRLWMSLFSDTQTCLFFFWLCGHSSVVFFILLLLYILHISFTYCLRCAATVLWQRSDSFHSLLVRVTQKDKEPRRLIRKLWFVFLRYC